jgi:hypothetical protein
MKSQFPQPGGESNRNPLAASSSERTLAHGITAIGMDFDRRQDGVAQRVRAEREQNDRWTRVLETIYWWPAHEG